MDSATMDSTGRWIETLLMYIFYDGERVSRSSAERRIPRSADRENRPLFPPSLFRRRMAAVYGWLRWMDSGDFIFDESACEA